MPSTRRASCSTLFTALQSVRVDPSWWRALSTAQALGLDYKAFTAALGAAVEGGPVAAGRPPLTYGTSSIALHVSDFFAVDGPGKEDAGAGARVAARCAEFAAARRLDVLIVLSYCQGARQIALLHAPGGPAALSAGEFERLASALIAARPSLQLEALPVPEGQAAALRLFAQGASTASRKQVVPLWAACVEATVGDRSGCQ